MTRSEIQVFYGEITALRSNIESVEREKINAKTRFGEERAQRFREKLQFCLRNLLNVLDLLGYQVYLGEKFDDIDIMSKPILGNFVVRSEV